MPNEVARTPQKIPARYIGPVGKRLSKALGPYFDASGTRRTKHFLNPGDTLMLPDVEVLGQTYLFDPKGEKAPLWLGVGRVVLPQHQQTSERDLAILGYEFHAGRSDFEPLAISTPVVTPQPQPQAFVILPLAQQEVPPLALSRNEQGA